MNMQMLSENRKRLVELMQRLNFGRIEGLVVEEGEPVFDPPPRVFRIIKFGAENGSRPEIAKSNFELKASVLELLAEMEALGEGVICSIEVQHGLPFRSTEEVNV